MKLKLFLISLISLNILYANNSYTIVNNQIVNNGVLNKAYKQELVYNETQKLIETIQQMVTNKQFRKYLDMREIGNTKVNTTTLLDKLLIFLQGKKPYSNTIFDNNSKIAGILAILKDNNTNLELTSQIKEKLDNTIKSSQFFVLANNIENSLKNPKTLDKIIQDFNKLYDKYISDISEIHINLLDSYNKKIADKLLKDYRIDAKTNLMKTLKIFQKYFHQNLKIYK